MQRSRDVVDYTDQISSIITAHIHMVAFALLDERHRAYFQLPDETRSELVGAFHRFKTLLLRVPLDHTDILNTGVSILQRFTPLVNELETASIAHEAQNS